MIRTVFSIDSIPSTWIFQHYCNITEDLHGQDVTIYSVFKTEKTPSMCIYYDGAVYKFKDFSSGNQGTGVDLVMKLKGLRYHDAMVRIMNDYTNKPKEGTEVIVKKQEKFKVTNHVKRKWNQNDVNFWTKFNIGSATLSKYNVFPLKEYTMTKTLDGKLEEITTNGQYLYGYFKATGDLYKVYQPLRSRKFINVATYIQGSEQLTYSAPLLVICSSLKDMMTLDTLQFDLESVAPGSENSMLTKPVLSAYSLKYKGIMTFFDNDEAGQSSMHKYKEKYGIPGIFLKMSKDLSDSVRDFGVTKTKQYLKPLIPTV
jgi:hypothetical protein